MKFSSVILLGAFLSVSAYSKPDPIIVGDGNGSNGSSNSSSANHREEVTSCSGFFTLRVKGDAPLIMERSAIASDKKVSTLPSVALKENADRGNKLLSLAARLFGLSKKTLSNEKTLEEKTYDAFLKYWREIIRRIEASSGLKLNQDFYRSYWVHEYDRPVSEWEKFVLMQFVRPNGDTLYYFFSESQNTGEDLRGGIRVKGKDKVHQHQGYSFGPLEQLDVPYIRSFYQESIEADQLRALIESEDQDSANVKDLNYLYKYVIRGQIKEFILPLSETESLRVSSGASANTIEKIDTDNRSVFKRERKETSEKLDQLFTDWKKVIEDGEDSSSISDFYKEFNDKVRRLFEKLDNEDIDFTDLQIVIRQISEQYRNLSRQVNMFSLTGLEKDLIRAFSEGRMGALTLTQTQKLFKEVSMIIEFKRFHLSQLQRTLQIFEGLVSSNYKRILNLIKVNSYGELSRSAQDSFEEAFNDDIRASVALAFEASYILEERRNSRLSALLNKIEGLSALEKEEGLELLNSLKSMFGISDEDTAGPSDIEIDLPVLDFIYFLNYESEIRYSGGRYIII